MASISIALRTLKANALRSVLTMLGVIIGVAAVVAIIAIGSGAQGHIDAQLRSMGSNLLLIQQGASSYAGVRLGAGTRHTLSEGDAQAIRREVPIATAVAPAVQGVGQAVWGNTNWSTTVVGAAPDHLDAREWQVGRGRSFSESEVVHAGKVVLLGATTARKLFANADPLGELLRIDDVPFTVIGELTRKGQAPSGRDQDDLALVPIRTAKLRLFGGARAVSRESIDFIWVKVQENADPAEAMRQIRALLRQRHDLAPDAADDFVMREPAAAMAVRAETSRAIGIFLAAVASISLLVGGIGIMNMMLIAVTERTREIGVRLAVGARRRDVRNQFLIESLILCLLGGIAGIGLGIGVVVLITYLTAWPTFISPLAVALAFGFAAVTGVFFGFYPAHRASRVDPIEALQAE